jgi:hypothetical protein
MSSVECLRRAAAALALVALTALTTAAQPAADPDLTALAVRGVFAGLSPDWLLVDTGGGRRAIPAADIDRVTRTRFGIVLGTLIGLGTGVALAIPVNMMIANEGGDALGDTAKLLALSTGIGFGVDAAVNLPRTVYRRGEQPRVRVAPTVTRGGAGAAMTIGF